MFRSLRENGPVVLVPAAWSVVIAAHLGAVADRTLLIAHIVMVVLQALFVVASWTDMQSGVLRIWRSVILVGIPVTAAGLVGLAGWASATPVPESLLLGLSVIGWMLLPAVGFVYTGRELPDGGTRTLGGHPIPIYGLAALLCVVGIVLYGGGFFAGTDPSAIVGLALVGIGQTAGIVDAVLRG